MEIPFSFPRGARGIYVYRRRVPADLKEVVGTEWWKISLKTALPSEARAKAIALAAEHNDLIAQHRGLPLPKQRLARLEALRQGNVTDTTEAPHVDEPQRDRRGRLWEERQAAIERLARQMLAEAEKRLAGLPDNERAMIEANGGLRSFWRQTDAAGAFNAHLQDMFAPGASVLVDPAEMVTPAEQYRRQEELARDQATIAADTRGIRKRAAVLEKLDLRGHASETEDPSNPRINTVLEKWLKHQNQKPAAARRHRVAWRRFVEVFGNIPVGEITRAQVLEYRTACEAIPDTRKVPAKDRGRALSALEAAGVPAISSGTVDRHLNSIKAMLAWCCSNVADFRDNVAKGIVAAKDRRRQVEIVRSFKPHELRTVLEAAARHYDDTRGRYRPRKRDMLWLIHAACYSGCRLEELCQLARENVRQVGDIWVLDLNANDGRKLKNNFSERLVPVHPALLERGFIAFAKDGIGPRVFSSLKLIKSASGATYGNAASSSFARFLDTIGMPDPTLKFHSFRHSFIEAMRNAEVPYSIELALVGHQDKHNPVHGGYGSPARVELLAKWIVKVDPLG